jgi:hypothetical protein
METHPLNDIDGQARAARDSGSALRWMSSEQLLDLGMNQIVYLKSGMCDDEMLFVLFGADGRLGCRGRGQSGECRHCRVGLFGRCA